MSAAYVDPTGAASIKLAVGNGASYSSGSLLHRVYSDRRSCAAAIIGTGSASMPLIIVQPIGSNAPRGGE